ncbi:MAG: alpha-D-ribose 1-methylphosphonate 5-triphosphate diphosphatase [Candidatus Viridilinea halotolerans]|uniref:Alpha-D-ribose 1-methylphosphonate 5-triphosphate diphosphatase n=1 Tax=Candidatus Viridilinea halotolerans TaxID=2491704 RepID=A0A426TYG2_9CHLR|nr:MAG: alpha-D-ribose 1-methylphosphonate 5-triphosphate diphosphatase [Candidatus Viridilinea halotolerans]
MDYLLSNAHVVLPNTTINPGWVSIEDGRISGVGAQAACPPAHAAQHDDLQGKLILPGIVDLHCDMIERMVQPRPGVEIPVGVALHATDRLLLGCGVTSEFHSLSLDDDEFGVRSDRFVGAFLERLSNEKHCRARHFVHARVEVSSEHGVHALASMVGHPCLRLISVMDHSPGQGQYADERAFRNYIVQTTGRSDAEIDLILERKRIAMNYIPANIAHVLAVAQAHDIPVASHDDDAPEKIASWAARGLRIAEFPTTLEAAHAAHHAGLAVGMGAPNVLRGQSSGGNLNARTALVAGVVDWLCADYYPAALLPAVFMLAEQGIIDLAAAVALISHNPAQAVGIAHELGSISVGHAADLIVVERSPDPIVRQVFVAGRLVMRI